MSCQVSCQVNCVLKSGRASGHKSFPNSSFCGNKFYLAIPHFAEELLDFLRINNNSNILNVNNNK